MSCICFFFLFKQKTAYEMRISDWSSDVCSSDLWSGLAIPAVPVAPAADTAEGFAASADDGGPRRQPELSEAVAYAPELAAPAADLALLDDDDEIGRASCREKGCLYVLISVGAVLLKKKKHIKSNSSNKSELQTD